MTPRRFDWGLRVHGTDLAAWPAAERAAALSLLRRCAATRQALADALAGEEDLPPPDPALLASLQGRLKQRAAGSAEPARPIVLRRSALGGVLTVCAVAGFYLGSATLDAEQPDLFGAVQAIAIDAPL